MRNEWSALCKANLNTDALMKQTPRHNGGLTTISHTLITHYSHSPTWFHQKILTLHTQSPSLQRPIDRTAHTLFLRAVFALRWSSSLIMSSFPKAAAIISAVSPVYSQRRWHKRGCETHAGMNVQNLTNKSFFS